MQFSGAYAFMAPRDEVWAGLNDTGVLKAAIPGCTSIEWVGEGRLEAAIKLNLGITSVTFHGELDLSDVDPARSYVLTGRGKGLLGRAEAQARITLEDIEGGTRLEFAAEGGASGQIVKWGKSLLGARAQSIIDGFFERVGDAMGVEVEPLPQKP